MERLSFSWGLECSRWPPLNFPQLLTTVEPNQGPYCSGVMLRPSLKMGKNQLTRLNWSTYLDLGDE